MNKKITILFNKPEPLTDIVREQNLAAEDIIDAVDVVEQALRELGHASERLPLSDDLGDLFARLRVFRPDVVFNLVDSFREETLHQMNVAALLDLLGLPYTGSGPRALGLTMDKALAKAVLAAHGIPVPKYQVAYKVDSRLDPRFSFPVIVKPLLEAGSYGITNESVVNSQAAVDERVSYIADTFSQPSIVEEFIDGREVNIAILGNDPPIVLPLSEIEYRDFPDSMPKICSFRAKWIDESFECRNTVPVCPAALPADVEAVIRELALRSHLALDCRDYSRVDVRLDTEFRAYVIDVNANPDVSPSAGYVRSVLRSGRTYSDFVAQLVASAARRSNSRKPPWT